MTRKMQLVTRAAGILRNADYCCGRQFVVLFGKSLWNYDEHRIGKVDSENYRIDSQVYGYAQALTLIKAYLDNGAYTLTDLDYFSAISEIVDGNTSASGLDIYLVEASRDCDNYPEMLECMGKTSDDLFQDVFAYSESRGLGDIW